MLCAVVGENKCGDVDLVLKGMKPITATNAVKFLNGSNARDKVMRFLQFFTRYLAAELKASGPKSELVSRLTLFYKGVSLHRKMPKLGKTVDEYLKLKEAQETIKDPLVRSLTMAMRAFMMAFRFFDNLIWASTLKVFPVKDMTQLKIRSNTVRMFASIANIALAMLDLRRLAQQEVSQKLRTLQADARVDLLQHCCDVLTYGAGAEAVTLSERAVGILGSVSSVAGAIPLWKKI